MYSSLIKIVQFIELENGDIHKPSIHGKKIPKKSNWIITNGNEVIRIPFGSPNHMNCCKTAVNLLLGINKGVKNAKIYSRNFR